MSGDRSQVSGSTTLTPDPRPLSPVTWVLTDHLAGSNAQALGVAEKLGFPFEIKMLHYPPIARLPNAILRNGPLSWLGFQGEIITWPDVIISAGRRAARVARAIKKRHPATFICQIQRPDFAWENFDLVAMLAHDNPPARANILTIPLAPHRLTRTVQGAGVRIQDSGKKNPAESLDHRDSDHRSSLTPESWILTPPFITVLVGGTSRHAEFSAEDFTALAAQVNHMAAQGEGRILATTSRRTGQAGEEILAARLPAPHRLYRWSQGGDNPYFAYLAQADYVVATADSVSMCSEALATGKPLYIFGMDAAHVPKMQRFFTVLRENNWARDAAAFDPVWQPAPAPDTALLVAGEIRRRMGL